MKVRKSDLIKNIILSSTFKTISIFAGGNLIAAVLSAISGLLYAQWITPEVLGEFSKYSILTGYLGFGLIFVHGALPRQYPYLIGKGEKEEAIKVASAAKWWYLVFSWCGTVIFIFFVSKSLINADYRSAVGWAAQIPAVWMTIYGAYLQVLYRSSGDFKKLSFIQVVSSSTAFILLIIVKLWGYWGFVARYAIQSYTSLYAHQYYVPEKIKSTFNFKRLVELAKVSLPLTIPSYIDTLFLTATINFFILTYLGEKDLGIYTLALTLQGMMFIFTRAIHQIFITKITIKFGETEDVFHCFKYAQIPTLLSFLASFTIAGVFTLFIGPILQVIVPKYIDSIPVLKILIWQLPLFAAGLSFIVFSSAVWYRTMIILRVFKILSCVLVILIFSKTLTVICISLILADIVYLIGGYGVIFLETIRNKKKHTITTFTQSK